MATELARTLPAKELIEKGICPIRKEYIVDDNMCYLRKQGEVIGSAVPKHKHEEKKSNTQRKKVPLTNCTSQ